MDSLDDLRRKVEAKRQAVSAAADELHRKLEAERLAARPKLAGGKRLDVWMLVDEAGTSLGGPDTEYAGIERDFRYEFANEMDFRRDKHPRELTGRRPDLYVIDFGGLSAGCIGGGGHAITDSTIRELARQVLDHPNTAFVLWSSFTERWYDAMIREVAGNKVATQANVVYASGDDWVERIKSILG